MLTRERDILIASHKAMMLAVGELGGMKAWRKFFEGYQEVVDEMQKLGAIPEADMRDLPRGQSNGEAN